MAPSKVERVGYSAPPSLGDWRVPLLTGLALAVITAVPYLFQHLFPSWFTGIAFAAIVIGALVPAAIMAIAAANLFQHDGPPITGRARIRAEDPSRTRILGNFRYRYWFTDVDMSSATWARKHLGGAHARMEQDPRVWAQAGRLIRQAIPQ